MQDQKPVVRLEEQHSLTPAQQRWLDRLNELTPLPYSEIRKRKAALAKVLDGLSIGPLFVRRLLMESDYGSDVLRVCESPSRVRFVTAAFRGHLDEKLITILLGFVDENEERQPQMQQAIARQLRGMLAAGEKTFWFFGRLSEDSEHEILTMLPPDERMEVLQNNIGLVRRGLLDRCRSFLSDEEFNRLLLDRDIHLLRSDLENWAPGDDGSSLYNLDELRLALPALSIEQIALYLQGEYIFNHKLIAAEELCDAGVAPDDAPAAIQKAYQEFVQRNIGHAVQFAWRYPKLNIQNIPTALNAAGLVVGNNLPEEIARYVWATAGEGVDADAVVVCARKSHAVTPQEFLLLRENNPKILEKEKGKPNAELIMGELADTDNYVDDEHIRSGMRTVRDIVGADIALQYANRIGLSRHDAFHFAGDIAQYFRQSGMTAKEFGSVLLQVAKDDAQYAYGNAHARFAEIMQTLSQASTESVLAEARQLTNIEELQKLVREIEVGARISWKQLRKIYDVKQFLGRRELLEELNRGSLDPKLRAYVLKLAFHENIAMDKVMQFWKQPHDFLEIDDGHTSHEINASKKPSNYVSLPFLGMTAEDLRDALVQGSVDRVQTLPPMERTFVVAGNDVLTKEEAARATSVEPAALHAALVSAIGMQRKGIAGKARDAKMVFGRVQGFLKECGVVWAKAWDATTGPEALAGMSDENRKKLAEIIDDSEFGIPTKVRGDEYRMILGNKSDPDMVIAGNDTASCMPFGSGKNNVYMYNPNCMQLVLQRKTSEGAWRTAAQSVVTIDVETGKPTPDLIEAYKQQGRLKDLVDIDRLARPGTVTCDNIEIAKNEEGSRSSNISKLYTRFWKEYLATYAPQLRVDPTHVMVGTGYTPAELNLPSVDNTYIPLAPMVYSDNVHKKAFEIQTGLPQVEHAVESGIARMTTRDVLAIAILEGKAYHDNVSLLENLHGMQNNIIGMEIANAHFDRPNLSFVYRDGKGKPRGYMLAYEGRNGSKQEIYISDLAADPESKLAGGKLIASFFDAYIANYGIGDRPFLPMFTNARDKTSYRIIQSQFTRFLDRAGLVGEIVELGTHQRDQDVFHDLRMFVGRTQEDIDNQKAQYTHTSSVELDVTETRRW